MRTTKTWILCLLASTGLASLAAPAAAQTTDATVVEELVVTGVRGSLARGVEIKRSANQVVDAISAKDIADFPDSNISESLQRISGVTITRTNGEGELVSIRGLAPQFTKVTLGGLPLLAVAVNDDGNVQNGRATNFDVFPAELFSRAVVYKTPAAELSEGGLSGTVDLNTPGALDGSGRRLALSLAARRSVLGEETRPQASLVIGDTFAGGRFGVLLQAAYGEDFLYSGISEGTRWYNTFSYDLDRDGVNEFSNVEVARLPRVMEEYYDRTRMAATLSLAARPTDDLDLGVDLLFARSDKDRTRHQLALNLFGAFTPTALTVDSNNSVVSGAFRGVGVRSGFDYNAIETENQVLGAHGDWRLSPSATLKGRASLSRARFNRDYYSFNAEAAGRTVTYDFRGSPRYPVIAASDLDFNDASAFRMLPTITHQPIDYDADARFARLDLDWRPERLGGAVVKAGVEYNDQVHDRDQYRGTYAVPAGTIASLGVGAAPLRSLFPDDGPAGTPRTWAAFDRDAALRVLLPARPSPAVDPQLTYQVSETVTAAYLQVELSGEIAGRPLRADAGLRHAHTDQSVEGFAIQGSVVRPVRYDRGYDDLLPSLNLRLDLTPSLVARVAASRSVTRPNLSDLAPSETVSAVSPTVTRGNPELAPYRANQADVSVEWYFAPEALLSVAGFYKKIEGFVTTQAVIAPYTPIFDPSRAGDFLQTTPVNGDDATVTGLEISYQQPFLFLPAPLDGFGILANLTYSDSEATSTSVVNNATVALTTTLPGQSKVSYNLVGYYEKGRLSARLAHHWRDDFLVLILGGAERRYQAASGQLDLSVSYAMAPGMTAFIEGLNLTGEGSYRYDRTPSRNISFADVGPTLTAGFRAKF